MKRTGGKGEAAEMVGEGDASGNIVRGPLKSEEVGREGRSG